MLIGLIAAVVFLAFVRLKPKEIPILAIGLAVAALIYLTFAIIEEANGSLLAIEIAGIAIYSLFSVLGLRYSKWWLMVGWMAHPLWDMGLHFAGNGAAFTPAWYPVACGSFDLLVAIYICGRQLGLINVRQVNYR